MKSSDLKIVISDVKQKKDRIESLNQDFLAHQFDKKLDESSAALRELEGQRDRLSNELASSTQQMESRTSLNLRKEEAQKLDLEVHNACVAPNRAYEPLN